MKSLKSNMEKTRGESYEKMRNDVDGILMMEVTLLGDDRVGNQLRLPVFHDILGSNYVMP